MPTARTARSSITLWNKHRLSRPSTKPGDASSALMVDHLFCDAESGHRLEGCVAVNTWPASELSDHAPLVADFRFED